MAWKSAKNGIALLTTEEIKEKYPLHISVWYNDATTLNEQLEKEMDDIEKKDPRGRTPLMLAVTLNHIDCVKVLTSHAANINTETDGWSAVQEATASGNEKLLRLCIEHRNYQRQCNRINGIPQLLQQLKEAPDFYVEMKWEFTSWMPLVSRMCPSDTYKVYKQGSKVRIDCTLMGFEEYKWVRGSTSVIFLGNEDSGTIIEIDHVSQKVYIDQRHFISGEGLQKNIGRSMLQSRLKNPIITSYMDTEKISFERNKSGVWGWRQDKLEPINGHSCKVFSASNVEIVTKSRTDHLDKNRTANLTVENHNNQTSGTAYSTLCQDTDDDELHNGISVEEYFAESFDLEGRDIGKPKNIMTKIRKFKTNLWLCEDYPLSFQEQIMPIVNLMATTSSHFRKLKDFIEMQLPSGFPVKIEIPLFHVLNTSVTFGNIFAMESPVEGVTKIDGENGKTMCFIDESLFSPPPEYTVIDLRKRDVEDDDDLLQYALENSFFEPANNEETEQIGVWDAIYNMHRQTTSSLEPSYEDKDLQLAIAHSLSDMRGMDGSMQLPEDDDYYDMCYPKEDPLEIAIALSEKDQEEMQKQMKLEEEMLQKVLQMSIVEK